MSLLIAARDDLPAVMQLYRNCVRHMLDKGIDQWGDFYPTEDILAEDIRRQELYLLEIDNDLVGAVVVNDQADPLYASVQWQSDDAHPLIVHRLAIDPAWQGQGYAQMIMEWVEEYAKSNDYATIRLDAYQGNPAALAVYEKCFYIKTGEVTFPHRSRPFNCYEKCFEGDDDHMSIEHQTHNQWCPIFETTTQCDELVGLLRQQGFTVAIFCDPQCEELYMPGLQHGKSFGLGRSSIPLTFYIAVPRDQRHDASRIFEQWHQQQRNEHLNFKMTTFGHAFSAALRTIIILGILVMIYRLLPFKFTTETEVVTLLAAAPAVWTLVFFFTIHRQQSGK